jgi:predicted RNA-binding Zn-ribbon protein involved in translation (DUF1610 family)
MKKDLNKVFSGEVKMGNDSLKRRLVNENYLEYKCIKCGNEGEWMGEKITLELDHINGNSLDNRLENLRFLCPNCHSQTKTFRRRNIKRRRKINESEFKKIVENSYSISEVCIEMGLVPKGGNYNTIKKRMMDMRIDLKIKENKKCKCGNEIGYRAKMCVGCYRKESRKVKRPSYGQLLEEIEELGYSGTGRKYGVSDNAIRKWKLYYEKIK